MIVYIQLNRPPLVMIVYFEKRSYTFSHDRILYQDRILNMMVNFTFHFTDQSCCYALEIVVHSYQSQPSYMYHTISINTNINYLGCWTYYTKTYWWKLVWGSSSWFMSRWFNSCPICGSNCWWNRWKCKNKSNWFWIKFENSRIKWIGDEIMTHLSLAATKVTLCIAP